MLFPYLKYFPETFSKVGSTPAKTEVCAPCKDVFLMGETNGTVIPLDTFDLPYPICLSNLDFDIPG